MTSTQADFSYTVYDALKDGRFISVFENTWPMLRGGRPSVATMTLFDAVGEPALVEAYARFAAEGLDNKTTKRRPGRSYIVTIDGHDVCMALDGDLLTMFYADED